MPLNALAYVLAAAALHTAWNIALKGVDELAAKEAVTLWALVVGAILGLPVLILSEPIPVRVWPHALASSLAQLAYFLVLVRAYEHGDFSVVYPVARGIAPVFIALWAFLFFLRERLEPLGLAGLALLLVGLSIVAGPGRWGHARAPLVRASGTGLALGTAICISAYPALRRCGGTSRLAALLRCRALVFALPALLMAPVVLMRHGHVAVFTAWKDHRAGVVAVAALMLAAYMLALQAYAIAPLGYVGALREVSVVFGAVAGWRWLGEGFGAACTVGSLLIFLGIVVVALAGAE